MDQLADVKTKVKAWERAFKRDNGRAPTKDDIRKGGEIAEQYALWRKLSKEAEKQKALTKENGKRKAEDDRDHRRRHDDLVTTPTPRRRTTARLPSPPPQPRLGEAGPSSRPNPVITTPKRRKLDDNPFSVPREAIPPSPSMLTVYGTPKRDRFDYVHASTPKQLKALLESARKSQQKVKDTPRTHARRWLAGEVDSPVHRKREFRGLVEDVDDELGETPIKGEAFAILEDEPKGRDLFPIFRRAAGETSAPAATAKAVKDRGRGKEAGKAKAKEQTNGKRKAAGPEVPRKKPRASLPDEVENEGMDEDAAELVAATPPQPTRSRAASERVLELTDDEFDPEASPVVLTITGTRRTGLRLDAMLDDDDIIFDEPVPSDGEEEEEGGGPQEGVELVAEDPRSMLSLLSLRSPIGRAGERMADLRVRALLDPTSAAAIALRARRRGQDVFACGETGFEEEYLEIGAEVEVEGDDDWESDAEGWKAEGEEEEW